MIAEQIDPQARREILNALRVELATMPPAKIQEVREMYYAIADNLRPLALLLENADALSGSTPGRLLGEHFKLCEMIDVFERVDLGGVL
jgi:hypothetical protein